MPDILTFFHVWPHDHPRYRIGEETSSRTLLGALSSLLRLLWTDTRLGLTQICSIWRWKERFLWRRSSGFLQESLKRYPWVRNTSIYPQIPPWWVLEDSFRSPQAEIPRPSPGEPEGTLRVLSGTVLLGTLEYSRVLFGTFGMGLLWLPLAGEALLKRPD